VTPEQSFVGQAAAENVSTLAPAAWAFVVAGEACPAWVFATPEIFVAEAEIPLVLLLAAAGDE
jgi:hypothetical protein